MEKIKSIAIAGKGGTGKTVVATLLIRLLAERYNNRVLAIDADSAMSLPYTLGVDVEKTVSEVRKGLVGRDQLRSNLKASPTKDMMKDILTKAEGFDLLTMGRPEEPGCFCAVNELLKYGIDSLVDDYEITVIDGEAGPEQLNRRVMKSIDVLLVVADMSRRSLETAKSIIKVAQDCDDGVNIKKVGLVLNRVRDDKLSQEMIEKIGVEISACLPEDSLVNSFDRSGRSLLELPLDSECPRAISSMLDKMLPQFGI
ncbi:MAG: AAA family ATPase [Firmicutes bacterium]|jgi:CO dehydrogenase maturation factor|nr:AAA family ATPase [Bacillota bacterium]